MSDEVLGGCGGWIREARNNAADALEKTQAQYHKRSGVKSACARMRTRAEWIRRTGSCKRAKRS